MGRFILPDPPNLNHLKQPMQTLATLLKEHYAIYSPSKRP